MVAAQASGKQIGEKFFRDAEASAKSFFDTASAMARARTSAAQTCWRIQKSFALFGHSLDLLLDESRLKSSDLRDGSACLPYLDGHGTTLRTFPEPKDEREKFK